MLPYKWTEKRKVICRLALVYVMYESAQKWFIFYKNPIFWNVILSDLADQVSIW